MNIAIIGRTEMLYDTAELLAKKGHCIKIIVTSMEAVEYKKKSADFKELANRLGAEFLYNEKIDCACMTALLEKVGRIDIGISVNYVSIIPQDLIDLFPLGILNAHGGDLPRYRGNACQAWAIINGEEKIGLCIHKMDGGSLDSGDIIEREYLKLDINVRIGEVYEWMRNRIPYLFLDAVEKLEQNSHYVLEVQSKDKKDWLRCYPRQPKDGIIDWKQDSSTILRLVNASSEPFEGAYCFLNGKKMVIRRAELFSDNEHYCAVPGQVCEIGNGYFTVITGNGKLKVTCWECDEKVRSIRNRLV